MAIPKPLNRPSELAFQGNLSWPNSLVSLSLPPSKSQLIRRIFLSAVRGLPMPEMDSAWPQDVKDAWSLIHDFLFRRQQGCHQLEDNVWEAGEAGTVVRFGLAFLVAQGCGGIIQGSGRAHSRPIGDLVDSLAFCGANIEYISKSGYPPLKIKPSLLTMRDLQMEAGKSSQFISAMLMVAPLMRPDVLKINPEWVVSWGANSLSSRPYLALTVQEMSDAGYFVENTLCYVRYVPSDNVQIKAMHPEDVVLEPIPMQVEGDWSAASFWIWRHAEIPICEQLELKILNSQSYQGDSVVMDLLAILAPQVSFFFNKDTLSWTFESLVRDDLIKGYTVEPGLEEGGCHKVYKVQGVWRIEANDFPDMVPALVMWALLAGNALEIVGIGHLRYKESDRIEALRYNLELLRIPNETLGLDSLLIRPIGTWINYSRRFVANLDSEGNGRIPFPVLKCFGDHRIAMALSMLALPDLPIPLDEPHVVCKSYPGFWEAWAKFGYTLKTLN